MMQGYNKKVWISQKLFLNNVLAYMGSEEATYTNGPGEGHVIDAEVVFHIPHTKNVRFGGNLKRQGRSIQSSAAAEEEAAYRALRFIEKQFKVKVVDYNYSQRARAREAHNNLVSILESTLYIARDVEDQWSRMLSCIEELSDTFDYDPISVYKGPDAGEQVKAEQFCAANVREVKDDYQEGYKSCDKLFDDMKKLMYNMSAKSFYIE